jgi:membrane-bound metal-dependent hydrolase YbcI (DUF457 family)
VNTPSHFIMTAAIRQRAGRAPIATRWFLLGAIAPDLALYALSLGGLLYYTRLQGWSAAASFHYVYDYLYFNNPWWISAHNLLHAPLILLVLLALGWRARWRPGGRGHRLFWFAAACALHSAVDIATHFNDGPLLLFPLEWHTRFASPLSYWDPRHFGRQFAVFELLLDGGLLLYLLRARLRQRRTAHAGEETATSGDKSHT